MTGFAKACFYVTIATFLGFFAIEAILWMNPFVYGLLLPQLNPGIDIEPGSQAAILKALFINQGFYNLMAAAGGITGLAFLKRAKTETGIAFVVFSCVFGIVAALTLLATTKAYVLGVAQFIFPSLVLISLARQFAICLDAPSVSQSGVNVQNDEPPTELGVLECPNIDLPPRPISGFRGLLAVSLLHFSTPSNNRVLKTESNRFFQFETFFSPGVPKQSKTCG